MRILIAEDELGTSETYRMFLEDEGHKVIVTSNGEDCLQTYKANSNAFDVLILDYRMPLKDGGVVLREVLKINPSQKVVIASAFSDEWIDKTNLRRDNVRVLQKPFDLQLLLDRFRDLGANTNPE
jgi:DNA-binding response OmpR family regulator